MKLIGLDALIRNVRARWLDEAPSASHVRWQVAGTSFSYREIDDVAELSIEGIFSNAISRPVREDLLRCLMDSDVAGLLVDLRHSFVVLDEDALDLTLPDRAVPQAYLKPVALVVKPELEPLALQWMWEMTSAGLTRRTFTDPIDARRWIRTRVPTRTPPA